LQHSSQPPPHRHVFWDTWQDIPCALALQKMTQGARVPVCIYIFIYDRAQSCLTLCDPMECSPPGSSVHGILQARILEWVAMPSSRRSSRPRARSPVSCLLHWQAASSPLAPPRIPLSFDKHFLSTYCVLSVATGGDDREVRGVLPASPCCQGG